MFFKVKFYIVSYDKLTRTDTFSLTFRGRAKVKSYFDEVDHNGSLDEPRDKAPVPQSLPEIHTQDLRDLSEDIKELSAIDRHTQAGMFTKHYSVT